MFLKNYLFKRKTIVEYIFQKLKFSFLCLLLSINKRILVINESISRDSFSITFVRIIIEIK